MNNLYNRIVGFIVATLTFGISEVSKANAQSNFVILPESQNTAIISLIDEAGVMQNQLDVDSCYEETCISHLYDFDLVSRDIIFAKDGDSQRTEPRNIWFAK